MRQNPTKVEPVSEPDNTAVRVALWRALHVRVDPPPHVIEDEVGLKLAGEHDWRSRPDMDPHSTRRFRASIVARARFVEDLVVEQASRGVKQYVILGAGLDSFAQRRPEIASRLMVFEVDQPGAQAWKRRRLVELGFGIPEWLRLVPVDFEAGGPWWEQLQRAGFDPGQPAVASFLGVSMYISKAATAATLRQLAGLAPSSLLIMSFMLPREFADPDEIARRNAAEIGAQADGTPFISFFPPDELLALARDSGFKEPKLILAADLTQRYFAERGDGLRPARSEALLVATVPAPRR